MYGNACKKLQTGMFNVNSVKCQCL